MNKYLIAIFGFIVMCIATPLAVASDHGGYVHGDGYGYGGYDDYDHGDDDCDKDHDYDGDHDDDDHAHHGDHHDHDHDYDGDHDHADHDYDHDYSCYYDDGYDHDDDDCDKDHDYDGDHDDNDHGHHGDHDDGDYDHDGDHDHDDHGHGDDKAKIKWCDVDVDGKWIDVKGKVKGLDKHEKTKIKIILEGIASGDCINPGGHSPKPHRDKEVYFEEVRDKKYDDGRKKIRFKFNNVKPKVWADSVCPNKKWSFKIRDIKLFQARVKVYQDHKRVASEDCL